MPAVADNTFIVMTRDRRLFIPLEQASGVISGVLVDEAGSLIQANQLSSLKLWLHLRDDPSQPVGGINGVNNVEILNDTTRATLGNAKTITAVTINTVDDDFRGRLKLTIVGHGYGDGDLIGVRGVRGIKGANGDWFVTVIDANTVELIGSSGSGVYLSGGTAVKGLHLQLQPNDNAIVQNPEPAIGATEWHEAYVVAAFGSKVAPFRFQFQVENLGIA